jgi:DNA (cytosine-5)-methyltransferase 1
MGVVCIRTKDGRVVCGEPMRLNPDARSIRPLSVVGLFAGIGGLELGMQSSGMHTTLLCEWNEASRRVLAARFPGVPIVGDVRELRELPPCDVLTAGFPCKDVSQANKRSLGLEGEQSGLVKEVFRLLRTREVSYVVIENVKQMLSLDRGAVMQYITQSFEQLGYKWAYRLLDTRCFGLPQRRERVYFVASKTKVLPQDILFSQNAGALEEPHEPQAYGFSWQEGAKGIGWVPDGVPTIRCGSAAGVPSPPAVWVVRDGFAGTIRIEDAERLQGFAAGWTEPSGSVRDRWMQVGNAVSVPVAAWVASRILAPVPFQGTLRAPRLKLGHRLWTHSECSDGVATLAECPVFVPMVPLLSFLRSPLVPLSARQASGFVSRVGRGIAAKEVDFSTPIRQQFLENVRKYSCDSCG